jgi:hypothetical protein
MLSRDDHKYCHRLYVLMSVMTVGGAVLYVTGLKCCSGNVALCSITGHFYCTMHMYFCLLSVTYVTLVSASNIQLCCSSNFCCVPCRDTLHFIVFLSSHIRRFNVGYDVLKAASVKMAVSWLITS